MSVSYTRSQRSYRLTILRNPYFSLSCKYKKYNLLYRQEQPPYVIKYNSKTQTFQNLIAI